MRFYAQHGRGVGQRLMGEIRAVVITVSDACARGEREDLSGAALVELLQDASATIVERQVVSDDLDPLVQLLVVSAERSDVNLILTTGGTGLGPRDNTAEATRQVIEREAQGISGKKVTPEEIMEVIEFLPPGVSPGKDHLCTILCQSWLQKCWQKLQM